MNTNVKQESKRIWPCVMCTEQEFESEIREKLEKWGYVMIGIGGDWEVFPYICTMSGGCDREVSNHSLFCLQAYSRYLCSSIPEFLEATKAIAIERGWFKEVISEKETTTDKQDQESKNIIYRCEREQIDIVTDTLKGLGIKDCTVPNATNDNTIFLVNTKDRRKFIRCTYLGDNKSNVIECSTLDEFLQKVGEFIPCVITTEHKDAETVDTTEELTWKRECDIEELPTRLRRLAEYRKETTEPSGLSDFRKSVNRFTWWKTPEGFAFWDCVFTGVIPSNLEEVLTAFEKEHPELLEDMKRDNVNHPSHYTWLKDLCGIEVIDIVRHMDFDLGNAVKYILRAGHKSEQGMTDEDKTIEDLRKAVFYLNDKIKMLENNAVHE